MQMRALAELFDHTKVLVPVVDAGNRVGEMPLVGERLSIVPLTPPWGKGLSRKLLFPLWLLRVSPTIMHNLVWADAVHAPIPGDVGTIGMLAAWVLRKPLFVRHCGNWLKPVTLAERFWNWFMETMAGGRNLMLATGGTAEPPSPRNPNVKWIFSSSMTEAELQRYARVRQMPADGRVRLVIAARQEKAKGAGVVIEALPRLAHRFAQVSFEIIGDGSAIPEFKRLAVGCGVEDRVLFAGKLNHDQVLERLDASTLFVFPTTSSDGFPKAVLEALATGLPVLSTRVSVLPQLLGDDAGVLVDEASPAAVATGVETALNCPTSYETMSASAIQTARQYSLEAWRDTIGGNLEAAWGRLRG
jgi:hypothetical protein